MPKNVIHEAKTYRLEILDIDGKVDKKLMPDLDDDKLLYLYRQMYLMKTFDAKALSMQRQGRMGTWGSLRGQEAAQAGLALAMTEKDWLIPSFREHGIMAAFGVPIHRIYAYWRGDERGNIFDEKIRCLPPSVPVGSQLQHATGLGLAMRKKDEMCAAVGCGGDGASSEGDFHEALNFAGVLKARTLFFIQNNQWAISVPLKKQTAAESLAQRAHAYNVYGLQVDGNDVLAVYSACKQALEEVRNGDTPYLIEALTYRMGDHTTADDQSRYRSKEELEYWAERDPIDRMRKFLESKDLWDDEKEESLKEDIKEQVNKEVEKLEALDAPKPTDMFDNMFRELPSHLQEQRRYLAEEVKE